MNPAEVATALNNLGYFLTERKDRLDEALSLIQRAVNIDPTNGSFLDSLGWLYFQMGKLPEAKRYLEQAAVYEHQSSTIREHLGDLYHKLGERAGDALRGRSRSVRAAFRSSVWPSRRQAAITGSITFNWSCPASAASVTVKSLPMTRKHT